MHTQSPNKIVEEARTWLGVRFRHQGRNRQGVDCAGLVIVIANQLGLTDFETKNYSRRTTGDPFVMHFHAAGMVEVPLSDIRPGDVVLTEDQHFPCHCGFVGEDRFGLTFIHAHGRRRKVVEQPLADWEGKVYHVMRFPQFL